MAGVDGEVGPLRLHGPMSHVLIVGRILQFAVAAADLAEWAEVVAFAEE